MKKFLTLVLATIMAVLTLGTLATMSACGSKMTVGLITLHGESSTYDKNFIDAMKTACANLGLSDELMIISGIEEDNTCYEAAKDMVDQGCKVVFADSFGHEPFLIQAAKEFPEVQFAHATGTSSKVQNLPNFHNAFASIYEGRYLAGVAAGMKLAAMVEAGQIKASNMEGDNIIVGYVGAHPYAEVKSGYTSWFLGVQSVVPNTVMKVLFTGSWYDETAEKTAANTLINAGAAIISQHADSMGAPSACEAAGVPNVSYNGSTQTSCPNTYIVSSKINWVPYFEYLIKNTLDGKKVDTDWVGTLGNGAVALTELGSVATAAGTAEKLEEVKAQLMAGTLHVFDCSKFTVNGEHLTSYAADINGDYQPDEGVNVIKTDANGVTYFAESDVADFRSAPYFDLDIDGITVLTTTN